MAENQTDTVAEDQAPEFVYPVRIEDAGPATKKVSVEIPNARIREELQKQFKELKQQAMVPGFRPGHAPQRLIERKYSADVKDQVRRTLISESYEQAVKKNELEVIGEPVFENPDVALPEDGDLVYSFEVEVQPQIALPDLSSLKIKKPKVSITDENVQQALTNLREQQGTLVPVEDRGVQARDYLVADVHIRQDGGELTHQHDAQLVARPGRLGGFQVDDLADQLAGLKAGEKRTWKHTVGDAHGDEALRGKQVEIDVALKDIKHLEPAEMNQEFLDGLGFSSEQALLDALREQMTGRIADDVQQAMRRQVHEHLLSTVEFEVPAKLSSRQEDRVVNRRAVDLMMRGVPRDQVEANLAQLRSGAREEAMRELKLFFILQQVARTQNVDVDEAELNGRVAMLAVQRGRRPEKVKQEMADDGTLASLYVQMREQKAVDKLLEQAQVEEVDVANEEKAS
jgi:trigger factor